MLEIKNIMVFYENSLALNNVSMRCETNKITAAFGPNSAGKSTLMYAISGIILNIKKNEEMRGGDRITVLGEIWLNGENIIKLKANVRAKKGIILCPERREIFAESSVLENLRIGAHLASRRQAKDTMNYVLDLFPALKTLRKKAAGLLSGGEQQALAIGRALMAQPKVLLLDEPLMGLSPQIEARVVQAVKDINIQTGITVLITEQYARPILPIIDFGYVLENGGAILEGTAQ